MIALELFVNGKNAANATTSLTRSVVGLRSERGKPCQGLKASSWAIPRWITS